LVEEVSGGRPSTVASIPADVLHSLIASEGQKLELPMPIDDGGRNRRNLTPQRPVSPLKVVSLSGVNGLKKQHSKLLSRKLLVRAQSEILFISWGQITAF
jgi:hypothetical protein